MRFGKAGRIKERGIKAAQILRDIVKVKKDESEKAFAEKFLRHYCKLHKINENEIPEPAGALKMRNKNGEKV